MHMFGPLSRDFFYPHALTRGARIAWGELRLERKAAGAGPGFYCGNIELNATSHMGLVMLTARDAPQGLMPAPVPISIGPDESGP